MRHLAPRRHALGPLVVTHLLESFVLILVMVGVLLCVAEFMEDKALSLLTLFLVWCIEIFTLVRYGHSTPACQHYAQLSSVVYHFTFAPYLLHLAFSFLTYFCSIRTITTMKFFPRFVACFFMLFYIYIFTLYVYLEAGCGGREAVLRR